MNSKYFRRKSGVNPALKELVLEYKKRKSQIKKRLGEFALLYKGRDEDIFSELSFCILTANANASRCDEAIKILQKKELLLTGTAEQIRPVLRGRARFHNKKADYIVGARDIFRKNSRLDIKSRLNIADPIKTRDWLVGNIKGFGYKEASHFLRNIGLGMDLAILDRHILKNLKKFDVIDRIPDCLSSRKVYMDIENRMKKFSKSIGIPAGELDLLFWSLQTGFVLK